jgi:hypothetical protein
MACVFVAEAFDEYEEAAMATNDDRCLDRSRVALVAFVGMFVLMVVCSAVLDRFGMYVMYFRHFSCSTDHSPTLLF